MKTFLTIVALVAAFTGNAGACLEELEASSLDSKWQLLACTKARNDKPNYSDHQRMQQPSRKNFLSKSIFYKRSNLLTIELNKIFNLRIIESSKFGFYLKPTGLNAEYTF